MDNSGIIVLLLILLFIAYIIILDCCLSCHFTRALKIIRSEKINIPANYDKVEVKIDGH